MSQNTRVYHLHFVDVEISAIGPLLTPAGVLCQTRTVTDRHADKQTAYIL